MVGLLRRALEAVIRGIGSHLETCGDLAGKNSNTVSVIRERVLSEEKIGIDGMEVEVEGSEGEVGRMDRARETFRTVRGPDDEAIWAVEKGVLYYTCIEGAQVLGCISDRSDTHLEVSVAVTAGGMAICFYNVLDT